MTLPWQVPPWLGWPPTVEGVFPLTADAGPNATLTWGVATPLAGSISGGVPPYTVLWEEVGRTSETAVSIADPTDLVSPVTLDGPKGVITLKLTATDSVGAVATATVQLTLNPTLAEVLGALLAYRWTNAPIGAISDWPNVVGPASHLTQATGAKQPTGNAAAMDGFPGAVAAGGQVLKATLATPLAALTRPYFFAVIKPTARNGAHAQSFIQLTNAGATSWLESYIAPGAGSTATLDSFRIDSSSVGGVVTQGQTCRLIPQIVHGGFTNGGLASMGSGTAQKDSTATGTTVGAIDTVRIFAETDTPTVAATGVFSDLLLLTGLPTQRQIEGVVSILTSDYAIPYAPMHALSVLCTDIDPSLPIDVEWAGVACDDHNRAYYTPVYGPAGATPGKTLIQNRAKRQDDLSAWTMGTLPFGDGEFLGGPLFVAPFLYVNSGHFFGRFDTRKPISQFFTLAAWDVIDLRTVANSGDGYDYEYPFSDGVQFIYLPHTSYSGTSSHGTRILQYNMLGGGSNPFLNTANYLASPDTNTAFGITGWAGGGCDAAGNAFFVNAFANPRTGWKMRYNKAAGIFSNAAAFDTFDTATLDPNYIGYNDCKVVNGNVIYSQGELTFEASDGHLILQRPAAGAFNVGWTPFDTNTLAPDTGGGMNPGMSASGNYALFPTESHQGFWLYNESGGLVAGSFDFYASQNYNPTPTDGAHRKHAGSAIADGAIYLPPVFNNGHLLRVWLP